MVCSFWRALHALLFSLPPSFPAFSPSLPFPLLLPDTLFLQPFFIPYTRSLSYDCCSLIKALRHLEVPSLSQSLILSPSLPPTLPPALPPSLPPSLPHAPSSVSIFDFLVGIFAGSLKPYFLGRGQGSGGKGKRGSKHMACLIHALVTPIHGQAPTRLTLPHSRHGDTHSWASADASHPTSLPPSTLSPPHPFLDAYLGVWGKDLLSVNEAGGEGGGGVDIAQTVILSGTFFLLVLVGALAGQVGGRRRIQARERGRRTDVQPCGWLLARRADSAPPPPGRTLPFLSPCLPSLSASSPGC